MPISLASVRDALTAKGGYTITPQARMLRDLKDLVDNLKARREVSGTVCSGHSNFSPTGMSLGNIQDLVGLVKPLVCTCQSQTSACSALGYSCTCDDQSGCSCNTQSCSCNSVCSCYYDNGSCSCQSNYGTCDCNPYYGGCTCDYNSTWCGCEGDGAPGCGCHGYSGACGCQGQTSGCGYNASAEYSCGCYSQSGCTDHGYACTCHSRAATCPCNSYYG